MNRQLIKNKRFLVILWLLVVTGLAIIILGRIKLASDRPNLLLNPDFETGGITGWQFVGTSNSQTGPIKSADNPDDTIVRLALQDTDGRNWTGIGQRVLASPLQPYQVEVSYRWRKPGFTKVILRISQRDQAGQVIKMDEISPPELLSTGLADTQTQSIWQLLTHEFVTNEQTAIVEIGFGVVGSQATEIEIDDFIFKTQPAWNTLIKADKIAPEAIVTLIIIIVFGLSWIFWSFKLNILSIRHLIVREFPKELFLSIAFTLVLILIIELFLQIVFGLPKETFGFISGNGLYAGNATLEMVWGPIPYTVKTNSLGFRGEEILPKRTEGKIRIAALGDSVTDGFFVDNENTYPYFLAKILNADDETVEVLNAAQGGGSISKEYAILREFVAPLNPDIVVLTFVTNDIENKSKDDLISETFRKERKTTVLEWLFTQTAIGELMFDVYLRVLSESYTTPQETDGIIPDQGRYQIAGGDNYAANVEIFNQRYGDTDGLILNEPFSVQTIAAIENYLFAFERLNDFCQNKQIKLVFVYSPSYSQIYDLETSMQIRDILKEKSNQLSIPFLDLTPIFRDEGQNKVLHLAPLDFHHNPTGNRVMAKAIAEFLIKEKILLAFNK